MEKAEIRNNHCTVLPLKLKTDILSAKFTPKTYSGPKCGVNETKIHGRM